MKKILKIVLIVIIIISIIVVIYFGFELKNKKNVFVGNEVLYKDNTSWKITSFGNNEGNQMMSFVIEGDNHGLIIIDGGYRNQDKVSMTEDISNIDEIINKHSGQVDAWIVTHFDEDHGGVFDYFIMNRQSSVVINKIYTPDVSLSLDTIKQDASWVTDWSVYEDYLSFPLNQEIKVHTGDIFDGDDLIGLKMKVLSSYEDEMRDITSNYLNSGAIVFKLYGNDESILFTSDVQDKLIGDKILSEFKEDLKSDYLQVPHHGNSSISYEFYDAVSPKIAIFCSPEWIFSNPNNISWYTAESLKEYLESKNIECITFATSPNVITLK